MKENPDSVFFQNLIRGKTIENINAALENIPFGVCIQTLEGEITSSNNLFANSLGYTVKKITSEITTLKQLINPNDHEKLGLFFQQITISKTISEIQVSFTHKSGASKFLNIYGGLINDKAGDPAGILIVIREINEDIRKLDLAQSDKVFSEAIIKSVSLLISTFDLEDVLDKILEIVGQVVPHDSANIMLINEGVVRVVRARNYRTPELYDFTMSIKSMVNDMPSMVEIIKNSRPLNIPDTTAYPGWNTNEGFAWIRSYLGAPLRIKGKTIGIINLDSGVKNFFRQEDESRLQAFADLAAKAIENASLYENLEAQAKESESLFRASTALLNTGSDIDTLAEQIVQTVHRDFTAAHCAVLLVDEKQFLLHRVAQSGYKTINESPIAYNVTPSISRRAIYEKKPVYIPDVSKDPEYFRGAAQTRSEFDIPLMSGENVIGVLNLESTVVDGFDDRSRRVLITYAERAATALENARLFSNLQKRDSDITLLNNITLISLETSDLLEMLEMQSQLLMQTFGAQGIAFFFSNPKLRKLFCGFAKSTEMEYDRRLNEIVKDQEISLALASISTSPGVMHENQSQIYMDELRNMFKTTLIHPLHADNVHVGILILCFLKKNNIDHEGILVFEQTARQIALAISKNLAFILAIEHAREAESLREATSTLTSTLNLQEIFEKILITASQAIPSAQKGVLFLFDETKRIFSIRAQIGYKDNSVFSIIIKEHEGLAGKSVDEKHAILFNQTDSSDPQFSSYQNQEAAQHKSWIVAPLQLQDTVFGVIELSAENFGVFTDDDLKILKSFADTVTAAIRNARMHSEVRQISLTDTLTDLYNRRGFEEFGQREMIRSQRTKSPLSLLLMDVDFLKQTNDEFGHNAGDLVLQEIANTCRVTFRQIDFISRYGGDEFAILLPDTPLDSAVEVANRLRKTISKRKLHYNGNTIKLSASIGVTEYTNELSGISEFFDRADKALYEAKESGRNKTSVWYKTLV